MKKRLTPNEYDNLDDALANSETATRLYLHVSDGRGTLQELSAEVGKLKALRTLNISSNLLKDLPTTLGTTLVDSLYIKNNMFQDLPPVIFQMPLQELNISIKILRITHIALRANCLLL